MLFRDKTKGQGFGQSIAMTLSVMIMLVMNSCSSSSSDLYELAEVDNVFIMTGNIESVLENADCAVTSNGIQLSAPLQNLVGILSPRNQRDVNAILEIKGIDLKHSIMAISPSDELIFAFKITDKDDVEDYIHIRSNGHLQLAKDGEYEYYRFDPNTVLFLLKDKGILLHSETATVDSRYLEQYLAKAKSNPLQSWQKSALTDGKTLNILSLIPTINNLIADETGIDLLKSSELSIFYDPEKIKNGYFIINCSLHDLDLDVACSVVDNIGKYIPTKLAETTPNINTSLLKYATKDDYLVAMASVPQSIDWNNLLNSTVDMMGGPGVSGIDNTTTSMLSMLLEDLSGTVMLAAGPQSIDRIDHLYGWHAVIAAEMREGKASHYLDMLQTFIDANNQEKIKTAEQYKGYGWNNYQPQLMKVDYVDDMLQISIPGEGTVYAKAVDNIFVASLSPISKKGGCRINGSDFRDSMIGLVIDIPKDNPFSTVFDFPFGCNVSYLSDAQSIHLRARQTETGGSFLNNLFEMIAGQNY